MTARIFVKSIAVIVCLTGVALVAADWLASGVAERFLVAHLTSSLRDKGGVLLRSQPDGQLDQARIRKLAQAAQARLTVVASDGRVIADSEAEPANMENHLNRPELQEAFQGRVGSVTRSSRTIGIDFLYVAIPMEPGPHPRSALRLAMPLRMVNEDIRAIRARILQSVALAFLPAVLIAGILARRLSGRLSDVIAYAGELANGNFQARLPSDTRGELGVLSQKLNETGAKLERTVQQLQTEHAELDRLERVRRDFVINVSHELRTPLASIQGYAETLIDGALHDEKNNLRFLNIIRHNAERLTGLTADLLTLSRLELRTKEFRFASFRTSELLGGVVDTIQPIAARKNITILQEEGLADSEVFCDSEAFYQVVSNLLDNAVKYTPQNGTITTGFRHVTRPDQSAWIEFYVRDTGMGIPLEDQSRLFERFYRVDKARSRELGGTGLGLAIVKHLVRAHGGDVRVESQVGAGATFFFTLPVDDAGIPEQVPASAAIA
jgi:two-component system phosphate regulon sensor histidine kinase PhoR